MKTLKIQPTDRLNYLIIYFLKKKKIKLNNLLFKIYYAQILWEYWAKPKRIFHSQPLLVIRRYYGEKLSFYFSWLDFYTKSLVVPSVIGFFVYIYGLIRVQYDTPT
jgi:hypothetical protein